MRIFEITKDFDDHRDLERMSESDVVCWVLERLQIDVREDGPGFTALYGEIDRVRTRIAKNLPEDDLLPAFVVVSGNDFRFRVSRSQQQTLIEHGVFVCGEGVGDGVRTVEDLEKRFAHILDTPSTRVSKTDSDQVYKLRPNWGGKNAKSSIYQFENEAKKLDGGVEVNPKEPESGAVDPNEINPYRRLIDAINRK